MMSMMIGAHMKHDNNMTLTMMTGPGTTKHMMMVAHMTDYMKRMMMIGAHMSNYMQVRMIMGAHMTGYMMMGFHKTYDILDILMGSTHMTHRTAWTA